MQLPVSYRPCAFVQGNFCHVFQSSRNKPPTNAYGLGKAVTLLCWIQSRPCISVVVCAHQARHGECYRGVESRRRHRLAAYSGTKLGSPPSIPLLHYLHHSIRPLCHRDHEPDDFAIRCQPPEHRLSRVRDSIQLIPAVPSPIRTLPLPASWRNPWQNEAPHIIRAPDRLLITITQCACPPLLRPQPPPRHLLLPLRSAELLLRTRLHHPGTYCPSAFAPSSRFPSASRDVHFPEPPGTSSIHRTPNATGSFAPKP